MPQHPGDRGGVRFQVPRRQIDDEPLRHPAPGPLQLSRQDRDMPIVEKRRARIQFAEGAVKEEMEVVLKEEVIVGGRGDFRTRQARQHRPSSKYRRSLAIAFCEVKGSTDGSEIMGGALARRSIPRCRSIPRLLLPPSERSDWY